MIRDSDFSPDGRDACSAAKDEAIRCWEEGWEAARAGLAAGLNPYEAWRASEWRDGYLAGIARSAIP